MVTNTGLNVPLSANSLSSLTLGQCCFVARGTREGRETEGRMGETEVRESAAVRPAWVSNIAEVVLQRPSGTM